MEVALPYSLVKRKYMTLIEAGEQNIIKLRDQDFIIFDM